MVSPKMKEVRLVLVPERHKRLRQIAKAEGSSIAVVIRRAINEFLLRADAESGV
jgi:predicted transcriptional regulator